MGSGETGVGADRYSALAIGLDAPQRTTTPARSAPSSWPPSASRA